MAKILFVCLGNICRSPTAEGVFRTRATAANLTGLQIDSAGTGDWHIDSPPDSRAIRAALRRGYDISQQRARQVTQRDFTQFTHILAMDQANLIDLKALAPATSSARLCLFLDYAGKQHQDVPDPYFGGANGFDKVLDLVEAASDGLISSLKG